MTVQDLYRVIFDEEKVEIKLENGMRSWFGKNEDIPFEYFEKIVNTIYSLDNGHISYIVIEIA